MLNLSRDQNITLRSVPVEGVPVIRVSLAERCLFLLGEGHVASVRACTGAAVCALGITTAPDAGTALLESPALGRNSALRVHVSGCPNSCAQHQVGDIGLAGSKVRIAGATHDGYQVYLGADLAARRVGAVVGRVAADDVRAAVEAIVGTWESLRHGPETLGQTANRIGPDAFAAQIPAVMDVRWASGPEDEAEPASAPATPGPGDAGTSGGDRFVPVCRVEDLPPGQATTVDVDGRAIALINVDGAFCALEDRCPHGAASLGSGTVDDGLLMCPLHGSCFDVRSGEAVTPPATEPAETFPVVVDGGEVRVSVARPMEVVPG